MENIGTGELLIMAVMLGGLLSAGRVMEAGSRALDAIAARWRR